MKKPDEFTSIVDKNRVLVKYLWRVILFQSAALIALSFSFVSIKETVRVNVELPSKMLTKIAPVVVAGVDGANEVYYKIWGKYIIDVIANFTFENVIEQVSLVKKMMRPQNLALKQKKIDNFSQMLASNLISQKFIIENSHFEKKIIKEGLLDTATIIVSGISKQLINEKEIKKECKYSLDLKYNKGVLYVEDFGTDCF